MDSGPVDTLVAVKKDRQVKPSQDGLDEAPQGREGKQNGAAAGKRPAKLVPAPAADPAVYEPEVRKLISTVRRRFGPRGVSLVEEAFKVAEAAHGPQRRTSGEPYITHPLAVAQSLAELGLDPDAVAAALLHDVVEDTGVDQQQIEDRFGPEIGLLVAGVTKMGSIEMREFAARSSAGRSGRNKVPPDALLKAEAEAENLRRMILASATDLRVLLIKLSDRLHNMQTLDALSAERRERMARETLDIYAPLANRLGISRLKSELEDLSLRVMEPEAYKQIDEALRGRRHQHQVYLETVVKTLDAALKEHGITADINSRTKHIYSIYRKMQRKELGPEQIYDVLAVRLLVDTIPDCYLALGVVHALWVPIPGEFDDYIGKRKNNLYQSLHTTVLGPGNRPLEVQIRTVEMHQVAEYGVAAHWAYKEGAGDKRQVDILKEVESLRRALEYKEDDPTDPQAFIDSFKSEVLSDKVYVLTPKGAVVELPAGSTPVDFAYYIHSEVGHRCRGALVDGKMVSLDTPLQTSQTVKIITAKGEAGPSRDWLNPVLGYVTTGKAKDKIRQWFKKRARAEAIAAGREVLERQLRKLGLTRLKTEEIAHLFDMERVDDFLAAVGRHELTAEQLGTKLLEDEVTHTQVPVPKTVTAKADASALGVSLAGVDAVSTHVAGCCHPLPGDRVVGYVTRGRGVTLHRVDCRNIERTRDREPERFININWQATRSQSYPVELRVSAVDRPGLVRDISEVLARRGVNMTQVSASTSGDGMGVVTVDIELASLDQLVGLIDKLEQIDNVVEVHRPT